MWMIQKIRLNDAGQIKVVQWQRADTSTNAWVGEPEIAPLVRVMDAVRMGKVGSAMPLDGGQGPYVQNFVNANGTEGIEADPSHGDTRSLFALPQF